ncbi:MAG: acylneuraminate cytidylyltransferase family protein [Thermodesulfovibrio sp.]|nr:acylneuraminate cytidylyltransferase family protein [Thermodesulfovibrio sp.]MDW7998295.1 acylneuraminate cytidylyltransferase family protein [Thermodesulfovibrio sp.]
MNTLCTICARGGSKGVPNKNIKNLLGKPLILWTIEQAKASAVFDKIVVSSDSDQILKIAEENGIEVFFKRASELATDESGKIEVIRDALIRSENYYKRKFEYIVDLDVTSPMRNIEDIKKAFQLFIENDYDNLLSVVPARKNPYFNMIEINRDGRISICKKIDKKILRRQDAPMVYEMNASIYIWKRQTLLKEDSIILPNTGIYVMAQESSFDIDTELDFDIVEFLMRRKFYDKR